MALSNKWLCKNTKQRWKNAKKKKKKRKNERKEEIAMYITLYQRMIFSFLINETKKLSCHCHKKL